MSEFDFITFDCYGTLIDWESGIVNAFAAEAAKDGFPIDPSSIVSAYHAEEPRVESGPYHPYRDVLAATARRVASRLGWKIDSQRATFLAASLPQWQPFPDTNAALERLARKCKLGILSNIDDELLNETRKHFTVNFDLIITAQQVRSYKPGIAHFDKALATIGVLRWLHAAQSYFHDVVAASKFGIPVAWINRKGEAPEPGGPRPTYEVRTLREFADLMEA
jgi:2-haloalkanoic acid dehalogenase type II